MFLLSRFAPLRRAGFLCLLLLLASGAFAQVNSSGDFVSGINLITFRPPSEWTVLEGDALKGRLFAAEGRYYEAYRQGYVIHYISPAISFAVIDIAPEARKGFEKTKMTDIAKYLTKKNPRAEFKMLGSAKITVAGEPALARSATFLSETVENRTIRMREVFVRHAGKLYIFEIDADIDGFKEAVPAFDAMMKSVRFLDKNDKK